MSISFPVNTLVTNIRSTITTAVTGLTSVPEQEYIPLLDSTKLPLAVISVKNCRIMDGTEYSLLDVVQQYEIEVLYLAQVTSTANSMSTIRTKIASIATALIANRTLSGSCNNLVITNIDFSSNHSFLRQLRDSGEYKGVCGIALTFVAEVVENTMR